MKEIVFIVEVDEDGGYVAKTRLDKGSIVTQGDTLSELKAMIIDAVEGYYFDKPSERPKSVRLHVEEVFYARLTMKLPRDLNGSELVKMLEKVGYQVHHQTGSHTIIKTGQNGENTQSVPNHKPLKIGTLNNILGEVADHLGREKQELLNELLRKK